MIFEIFSCFVLGILLGWVNYKVLVTNVNSIIKNSKEKKYTFRFIKFSAVKLLILSVVFILLIHLNLIVGFFSSFTGFIISFHFFAILYSKQCLTDLSR